MYICIYIYIYVLLEAIVGCLCSLEIFPRDTAFLLILLPWQTVCRRFLDRETYSSEVSFHLFVVLQ